MPHSLRAKLNSLRYKGILEDKDYKRLCNALDNEDVLEKIRAEIERGKTGLDIEFNGGIDYALSIIDKYKEQQGATKSLHDTKLENAEKIKAYVC